MVGMTLKILHTSDIHGFRGPLHRMLHSPVDFDVWVDTGDFLPTKGRGFGERIDPSKERAFQAKWVRNTKLLEQIAQWLKGRLAILCSGNHDFLCLGSMLKAAGVPNIHIITPAGVEVAGLTWAGFREVAWIDGEWPGETHDFTSLVDAVMAANPDVLVTHAPAAGILDGTVGYGVKPLTSALAYCPHKIKLHLHGHAHEDGGKTVENMGIVTHNGAGATDVISYGYG